MYSYGLFEICDAFDYSSTHANNRNGEVEYVWLPESTMPLCYYRSYLEQVLNTSPHDKVTKRHHQLSESEFSSTALVVIWLYKLVCHIPVILRFYQNF